MFTVWFGGETGSNMRYATHMPALAAAVLKARPGPVLEYGLGFFSTPLLHTLCEELGRPLLSLDNDRAWAEKFYGLHGGFHRIGSVATWGESEPIVDRWGEWAVVLIDHGPNERRVEDAHRLCTRAEFVVVHDWEEPPSAEQREILSFFRYSWVSRCAPRTAVLSNVRPFGGLTAP